MPLHMKAAIFRLKHFTCLSVARGRREEQVGEATRLGLSVSCVCVCVCVCVSACIWLCRCVLQTVW